MTQKTLVLIKPDGVERALVGTILSRFENVGLKIVALKMFWADNDFAGQHYGDLGERRGEKIKKLMTDMLCSGPVVAMVLEGVESIEQVRKMVGATEPKSALPGTIRGDFAHVSYTHADANQIAVKNVIHASSSVEDADKEIKLWFDDKEIHSYDSVHDKHILK